MMQRLLAHWHETQVPSWVTGRPLTSRATAYLLWHLADQITELGKVNLTDSARRWRARNGRNPVPVYDFGAWTPPPLAEPIRLRELRAEAINRVRAQLVRRAKAHLSRAQDGQQVLGVVLKDAVGGSTYTIPCGGGRAGLPGLYSPTWPTPIGMAGEATLQQVRELSDRLEVVTMTVDQVRAQIARHAPPNGIRQPLLDESSIAAEVASHFSRNEHRQARNAERRIERIVAEADEWEYQLLGREHITGRKPLP